MRGLRNPERRRDPDEIVETRPWGLIVLGVAFVVYLAFRIVQMISWGIEAIL